MAKRRASHAKGGFGRYSPPTRGRGAHAAAIAERNHRAHPAVTLVGTGLLASTGLFGLAALNASPAGASVGVECTGTNFAQDSVGDTCASAAADAYAGFGNTGGDTVNDNSAVADDGGTAYAGSANTGIDQTATDNSALASSGGTAYAGAANTGGDQTANGNLAIASSGGIAYAGSFGIGSKSTTTNNDTAIASTGGAAYAGTGEGDYTTADNDSATASTEGTATAGSDDTDTTADNDGARRVWIRQCRNGREQQPGHYRRKRLRHGEQWRHRQRREQ